MLNFKNVEFKVYSPEDLQEYMQGDRIKSLMGECSDPQDTRLVCQQWLENMPAKRMIFDDLYGDLLFSKHENRNTKVIDVGGGLTCLTRRLATQTRYTLIDPLVHDDDNSILAAERNSPTFCALRKDWYETAPDHVDLVIANDIFPNVDQRLELFLDWASRRAKFLRLIVTVYNKVRSYRTKRLDADEQLWFLAWNGSHLINCLQNCGVEVPVELSAGLLQDDSSLYPNGRTVARVDIRF